MSDHHTHTASSLADWLGITASAACAIHCLALPTLLVTGAVVPGSFFGDESFHLMALFVMLPAAAVAFFLGCRVHRDKPVMWMGIAGIAGMILAVTVLHDLVGEQGERVATVASAVLLVAAHYRNFRLCRSGTPVSA
ncbi:MAG: MerC domain-containing protein [Pseudomonadota bacterium]